MESSILIISPELRIPLSEIDFSYARSSGPGGQNVNKVNSKAVLRWNLALSPSVPGYLRTRLLGRLDSRLTREGEILVASDVYRDQPRNREDCLEKLREILLAASAVPKIRKKTRPSRSSVRKAKTAKSLHSQKKSLRKSYRSQD